MSQTTDDYLAPFEHQRGHRHRHRYYQTAPYLECERIYFAESRFEVKIGEAPGSRREQHTH